MAVILTDKQYAEAFLGAFGAVLSGFFFKKKFEKANIFFIIGFGWMIIWLTRKIGMNLYNNYKNEKNTGDYSFHFSPLEIIEIDMVIITTLLLFVFYYTVISKRFDCIMKYITVEKAGLLILGVFAILIYGNIKL